MYFHTQMLYGAGMEVMIKEKIKMMEIVIKVTVGELIQNICPSQVKVCHIQNLFSTRFTYEH